MGGSSQTHCPHTAPCLSFPRCPEQEPCWERALGQAEHSTSAPGNLSVLRICPGICCPSQEQGSVQAHFLAEANLCHDPGRIRPPFPGAVSTILPGAGLQEVLSGVGAAVFCQRPWSEGSHGARPSSCELSGITGSTRRAQGMILVHCAPVPMQRMPCLHGEGPHSSTKSTATTKLVGRLPPCPSPDHPLCPTAPPERSPGDM